MLRSRVMAGAPRTLAVLLFASAMTAAPSKTQPPAFQITDAMLVMNPGFAYPDQHRLDELYGSMTATYRVGGQYSFKGSYTGQDDLVQRISLDLTVTVKYERESRRETLTTTVNGTKTATRDAPAKGRKGQKPYTPSLHELIKETYSGTSSKRSEGSILPQLMVSDKLGLGFFTMDFGLGMAMQVPCKIHTDTDLAYDDDHRRSSNDSAA